MLNFYSNGKLLLTGEYLVLDGALALALPTSFGQSLTVEPIDTPHLIWKSFDESNSIWFEAILELNHFNIVSTTQKEISNSLQQILKAVRQLNPLFLNLSNGFNVNTHLNFPKNWGLGTSSTLINNISQWANVNAFELLNLSFGGSGYDIACAQTNNPISYQLIDKKQEFKIVPFDPEYKKHLYFVYLNKKQDSREGIAHYKSITTSKDASISKISALTLDILSCKSLNEFNVLIDRHEDIISNITNQSTIKNKLFKDFDGSIKSLGAWGGDFILASSINNPKTYFENKGFDIVISYSEMIL